MMSEPHAPATPVESFLIADIGTTTTTVVLFDLVDGAYRMIARGAALTTLVPPTADVTRGVQFAVEQITAHTGRRLMTDEGVLIKPERSDGSGVDYFGVTISGAGVLRVLVGGLMDDVSLVSARRALRTIYSQEVDVFSLADGRNQQEQLQIIWQHRPDVVFVAGGTDGGAGHRVMKLVETINIGLSLLNGQERPEVVFAGNSSLRPAIKEALGGAGNLHTADNVRPNLESEQLHDASRLIGELYEGIRIASLPGIDDLAGWCSFPLLATARAFAQIVAFFGALYRGHVLGIDLGSDSVTVASGNPEGVRLAVYSELGMGRPLPNLLQKVDPAVIMEWLPLEMTEPALRDFVENRALFPQTVPLAEEDLQVEQTLARFILRSAVAAAGSDWSWPGGGHPPPFKFLLLRGQTLSNAPRPGQAVLMALDALQPVGIFSVAADRYGVLPALGLLAAHQPLVAVQALEAGLLADLGWVVVPAGRARPGDKVMDVQMVSQETGRLEVDVRFGELEVLPLAHGHVAEITLRPTRHFDLGQGPGRARKLTVHGGAVGLVIDARGRPLSLPADAPARRELVRQWFWDIGG
jgi:hypothetical protein